MESHATITWRPDLLISGGQTGADMGGLRAAHDVGIATGGIAPAGFRTEKGAHPALGYLYGLLESDSPDYAVRTIDNVKMADAVILVTCMTSPGSRLTKQIAFQYSKPLFEVGFPRRDAWEPYRAVEDCRAWLLRIRPSILMIAGHRESVAPGICEWTRNFLLKVFS